MRRFAPYAVALFVVACSAGSDRDPAGTPVLTQDTGTGGGIDLEGGAPDLDGSLDGTIDPEKDNDGDGYFFKDDCDDRNKEVNPGAWEVPGDGVDNDCDGVKDNPEPDCDQLTIKYDSKDAMDFARALGLCRTATADAAGKAKRWGVIKAELVRADGSPGADALQYGILKKWGPNVNPRAGKNFIVLSSGTARTPDYPGWLAPLYPSWDDYASEVTPPAGWPKNSAGCPEPFEKTANDSVNLKLTIRVPTNAKALMFDFNFYSSEYIQYVCSEFNDSFVALLNTKAPIDPKFAGNVSVDAKGNPINVNSGFFEVCTPGTSTPPGSKTFACSKGIKELEGTGYWDDMDPTEHGATSWLETRAPVVPGETITMQFAIWDTGDHALDSSVLIDNWRWDAKGTTAPITDRPK
jgi:hypothetical protein